MAQHWGCLNLYILLQAALQSTYTPVHALLDFVIVVTDIFSALSGCFAFALPVSGFHCTDVKGQEGPRTVDKYKYKYKLLQIANTDTVARTNRLRRLGHVCWMDYDRFPKQLLVRELAQGTRSREHPKKHWKDCKEDLKMFRFNQQWCETAIDCKEQW